jgi:hypothetical protein
MQPRFQRPLNPLQSPISPSEAFKLSAYWLQDKYMPVETLNATHKQREMIRGNWLPKPRNDRNGTCNISNFASQTSQLPPQSQTPQPPTQS